MAALVRRFLQAPESPTLERNRPSRIWETLTAAANGIGTTSQGNLELGLRLDPGTNHRTDCCPSVCPRAAGFLS